jgi:hypothetical protein
MLEALTPIGVLAGIIIAALTAYRSEMTNRKAQVQSAKAAEDTAVAAEVLRAEKARQDYIEILEKEQIIVKSALADALLRIGKLEASEEICQQELISLTMENNRLRRQLENKP